LVSSIGKKFIIPFFLDHEVNKTVEILNIQSEVNDLTFSTKFIMKTVKEKIDVRDQEEWYDELLTDRGNQNRKVSCIRINLHKNLRQEIRCLLTHENQPISPPLTDFQFKWANHDILKVNSYKYLGIWPDEHLAFEMSSAYGKILIVSSLNFTPQPSSFMFSYTQKIMLGKIYNPVACGMTPEPRKDQSNSF
jgi:hypothetical protein